MAQAPVYQEVTLNETSGNWRRYVVPSLIVLGSVLAIMSVVAIWLNRRVVDTDAYVDTVTPLAADPSVQQAVAERLTDELFAAVDVQGRIEETLPAQVSFLAGPATTELRGFVYDQVLKIVESDEFQQIWIEANRRAHDVVMRVLLGEGDTTLQVQDNAIVLDMGVVIERVKDRLSDAGITFFEGTNLGDSAGTYTLVENENLSSIQQLLRLLDTLAWLLPLLAIGSFAGAIGVSTRRWRTIIWIGIGVALAAVVAQFAVAELRRAYIDSLSTAEPGFSAAISTFDLALGTFRDALRYVAVIGILVILIAFITSPAKVAIRIRGTVTGWGRRAKSEGEKIDLGPVGGWVARRRQGLRIAGIVVALIVLILIDEPTLSTVLLIVALTVAWVFLLEFIGQEPDAEKPSG